jgi:hypothetical protein
MLSTVAAAVAHDVEVLAPRPELGASLSGDERSVLGQFGATVAGIVSNSG